MSLETEVEASANTTPGGLLKQPDKHEESRQRRGGLTPSPSPTLLTLTLTLTLTLALALALVLPMSGKARVPLPTGLEKGS
jgi:hypothetical protein